MARAALTVFLVVACITTLALGAAPIWPWMQCGGTGGNFAGWGRDDQMFDCVEGTICVRAEVKGAWWQCEPDPNSNVVHWSAVSPDLSCKTVADWAAERNDLNMFLDAANQTGFLPFFTNIGGVATVFAPTDDAFEKLYQYLGFEPEGVMLAQLMQAHIVPGRFIKTENMQDGQLVQTAMPDNKIMIRKPEDSEAVIVEAPTGVRAVVNGPDNVACKTMLQVIGAVLLPDI